ncbi:MAG: GGDEF domain-containing protein, partial [Anaerolineales bacterium]
DSLKQINDTYGHIAGDMAIKAAGKILGGGTFRKEDVIARTGGDEFVILLPTVDLDAQPAIIERLEKSIEKHNQSNLDDGLYRPISLSFGHAVIHEGGSLEEGYKAADHAMYEIKSKNKISRT